MTDFQRFRIRKRIISTIDLVNVSAFVASMVAVAYLGVLGWIWLPIILGFGIIVATRIAANYIVFHCPNCRSNLAVQFMNSMTARPGRFCQYCGTDLDAFRNTR